MTNYLVISDIYYGTALKNISDLLIEEIKKNKLNVKIINFNQGLFKVKDGQLGIPKIHLTHNLETIKILSQRLKNNDNVFFVDSLQLGIGLLKYFLGKKKVKFGALFHGASFVKGDFFYDNKWLFPFEIGIFNLLDKIYAPSNFSAEFLNNLGLTDKVVTIPFGFSTEKFQCNFNDKKYDVIIPHRWSWEKDPIFYRDLIKSMPKYRFAVSGFGEFTKDVNLKKIFLEIISLPNVTNLGIKSGKDHFDNLSKSKIVIGTQDTFGYSIREAISSGCIPVLRNDYCYPDFFEKKYLFNDIDEAIYKIERFIRSYPKYYRKINSFSFKEILNDFFTG